ncbi:IS200/IS605 family transposase [Microbispora amethystogenes]|uniref:IS200/IS605 family transposase n=1 Tax=Microbispora amethystogenes TaxID=1427754 RepID=UPI0033CDE834
MRTSPGAAYDLGSHVVWCPQYRRPVLGGRVKTRLEELIRIKADEHGGEIVAPEVLPDHVHLFVRPYPQSKGFTSHHLRAEFAHLRSQLPPLWSRSYFVTTVGTVSAETVQRYIETQDERPKGGRRA